MENERLVGMILTFGRPVKDEEWGDDWRDYDWDHLGSGCPGWQTTEHSELVRESFNFGMLFMVTHCRCECRVYPHVTVGVEGTLGS